MQKTVRNLTVIDLFQFPDWLSTRRKEISLLTFHADIESLIKRTKGVSFTAGFIHLHFALMALS